MRMFMRIHPADNTAAALENIAAGSIINLEGSSLQEERLTIREPILPGHKFSLVPIFRGEPVIKYGFPIGRALEDIPAGSWVHTHNLGTLLDGPREYVYSPEKSPFPGTEPEKSGLHFQGYRREDGGAGIRNEIWIIPTVGCVNDAARRIAGEARKRLEGQDGIDGVYAFTHPYGCSQTGDDHETTCRILARLAEHPNAAGVLILGLGCENNRLEEFRGRLSRKNRRKFRFLTAQESADEIEEGLDLVCGLAEYAGKAVREAIPISELIIGLKCGGSDGLSGITANPLLGRFTDALTASGGTALLTEVPEMFGAETILMNRAENRDVFEDIVRLINDFKNYYIRHGQAVYENPSPGNKEGGITTLEEKSLGCVQKGGTSPVSGVYPYGAGANKKGLLLISGPGSDMVSVTALAAAGAQLVLFSTGRGTPLGGPVPVLKVSSNSALAEHKPNWIDFDAGRLAGPRGAEQFYHIDREFLDLVLETASGKPAKNEVNGYREIAIFKNGVTL